jgi:hypothetical protein
MCKYVSASIQDRVLFVVRSVLDQNSINADVHPESRLIDIGLDSMDIVALKPSSTLRSLNPRLASELSVGEVAGADDPQPAWTRSGIPAFVKELREALVSDEP